MIRWAGVILGGLLLGTMHAGELADAAQAQDRALVERLIQSGHDLEESQGDGMTALLWAAYHDDEELATLLLKAGAKAEAANNYGVTALSLACQNGNGDLVGRLLKGGADANGRLEGGETPLMTAARTGDETSVGHLVAAGAEIDATEHRGQTAMMWAAAEGNLEAVQVLLEAGAEFRKPLASGFTPFFFAIRQGHRDVAAAFLEAGVDVNIVANPKRTNAKSLRKGMSGLLLAVENGHFDLALDLLKAGADPDDARAGMTPLHMIVGVRKAPKGDGADGIPEPKGSGSMGSLEFARELVKRGADVNARMAGGGGNGGRLSQKGATPFLLAAHTDDLPYLKLLLELGADPTLTNDRKTTPLMAASGVGVIAPGEEAGTESEAVATVNFLLDLGADVNAVNARGETAMHGAAYKAVTEVIEVLDKRGADIVIWNRKNKSGWTPLLIGQGYRFGNYRPIKKTEVAIKGLMSKHGVDIPPDPEPR